ncbi:MAG TPA: hypothetical protein VMW48_07425, partial [Vicinamibacterales bacterium]|nr:hypothetical protein [Vicinamibacterales bacterium]
MHHVTAMMKQRVIERQRGVTAQPEYMPDPMPLEHFHHGLRAGQRVAGSGVRRAFFSQIHDAQTLTLDRADGIFHIGILSCIQHRMLNVSIALRSNERNSYLTKLAPRVDRIHDEV